MSTVKQALKRIASEYPETRQYIVPLLQRHSSCDCGNEMLAGEFDEMFAGRAYTPPDGPSKAENKDYGGTYTTVEDGKWKPKNKGKCYYQTGDEADRCYVTTNGGPGGQKKPDTGPASNKKEYNKRYDKQRWDGKRKADDERLAELREKLASQRQGKEAGGRLAELRNERLAKVKSKLDSMGMMRDLEKKHGGRTKGYYAAVIQEVKAGVIAPSAVVGGGYKDGKKVAIKWLEEQMSSAS